MWYGFNVLWLFSAGWKELDNLDKKVIGALEDGKKDVDFIADMGCNFVRLPVDYRFFIHDFKYNQPDEKMLLLLDECIKQIVSRGLHCSLNVHRAPGYCINGNELERDNLWTDQIAQDAFTSLWTLFAKRYAGYSKEQLSFDLLNEPPAPGEYGLTHENHKLIMARVAAAIRNVTLDRPIICDGLCGGHIACPELADLNVIMSGRGYTPFRLSHWKAEWVKGSDQWEEPVWPGMECDGVKWNRQALLDFYKPWKDLAEKGSTVHMGECGCYKGVPNKTALAWYKDLFSVYNELGFGFALWNFRGPFGIAEHEREGTNWEVRNGIKFDKDLYELFVQAMKNPSK